MLVRLNDETVRAGTDVQDALEDVEPGAHIDLLVARNNLPVEMSGTYEPELVTGPPRTLFARSGRSGRVDLTRAGNVVAGHDARRRRVHAAAVAGSVRLREAGEGRRQRPHRLRRPRAEGRRGR